MANYANSADILHSKYPDTLPSDFLTIKDSIAEKSRYKAFGEDPVALIRININAISVPAYMNIDAIYERSQLRLNLYAMPDILPDTLEKEGHTVSREKQLCSYTAEQAQIEEEITDALEDTVKQEREQIIEELRELHQSEQLNEENLTRLRRSKTRKGQQFIDRILQLLPYLPLDTLIAREELTQNAIGFNGLSNAVIYHALDANHPFKVTLQREFPIGRITLAELTEKANRVLRYFFDLPQLTSRTAQNRLGNFMVIQRVRSNAELREVRSYNPKGFTDAPLKVINPSHEALKQLIQFPE